jgi:hypothetical protein
MLEREMKKLQYYESRYTAHRNAIKFSEKHYKKIEEEIE